MAVSNFFTDGYSKTIDGAMIFTDIHNQMPVRF